MIPPHASPLKQSEYYRLFAFLNTCEEASVAVYTPDEQMRRADIFRQIHEIEAGLKPIEVAAESN